jgi:PAS domain S-box-containing protein
MTTINPNLESETQADLASKITRLARMAARLFKVSSALVCLPIPAGRVCYTNPGAVSLPDGLVDELARSPQALRGGPAYETSPALAALLETAEPPLRFLAVQVLNGFPPDRPGFLALLDPAPRPFSAEDRAELAEFSALVSEQVKSLGLLPDGLPAERVQAEASRLEAIIATQNAIATADLDLENIMALIAERARELTGAKAAYVLLVEGDELVTPYPDPSAPDQVGLRLSLRHSFSGYCVRTDQILRCDDTEADPHVDKEKTRHFGERSLLVVPLHFRRQVIGALVIASPQVGAFHDEDVQSMQLLAGIISAAFSHASEFKSKQDLLLERTAALAALQESEKRFKSVFDESAFGMSLTALDGDFLQVNRALCEMTGYAEPELLALSYRSITHPDDLKAEQEQRAKLLAGPARAFHLEKRYRHKQGQPIWVLLSATLVSDQQGQPLYFISHLHDITERKQAEDALRKNEALYRTLARHYPNGSVVLFDRDLRFTVVEGSTIYSLGRTRADYEGRYLWEAVDAETARLFEPHYRAALAGEERSFEIKSAISGLTYLVHTVPVKNEQGEIYAGLSLSHDITDYKRMEERLRESEERYRVVAETANDAILTFDESSRITFANPAAEKIFGYTPAEMTGLKIPALLPVYMRALHADALKTSVEEDQPDGVSEPVKFQGLTKSGELVPLEVSFGGQPKNGRRIITAVVRDISERIKTEEALQKANEELERRVEERTTALKDSNAQLMVEIAQRARTEQELWESNRRITNILESITDGFFALDNRGRLTYLNPQAERLLRKSGDELVGKTIWDEFPEPVGLLFFEQAYQNLNQRTTLETEGYFEPLNTWFEVRAYPYQDGLAIFFRDITERKRAEEEVRKALAKERELSELKSRFVSLTSHEFRTPLSTILASAELLEYYSHKWSEEKKKEILGRIQISVKHMTQLLEDVLLIGKAEAGKLEFRPVRLDLVKFCRELVEEFQFSIGPAYNLEFRTGLEMGLAWVDEKLLRQILSNLLSNAVKYSSGGGPIQVNFYCQDDQAVLQVQDYGIGIPPEDQERLFELFHRASNVGTIPGTGLGLAIVKKSVDLHGGSITFESAVGTGTTFTLALPLSGPPGTNEFLLINPL